MFNHGSFLYFENENALKTNPNGGEEETIFSESSSGEFIVGEQLYSSDELAFAKSGYIWRKTSEDVYEVNVSGIITQILILSDILNPDIPPHPSITFYSHGLFKKYLTQDDFNNNNPQRILVEIRKTNENILAVNDVVLNINNVVFYEDGYYSNDLINAYHIIKGKITEIVPITITP